MCQMFGEDKTEDERMTEEEILLMRALAFLDCYCTDSVVQDDIRHYLNRKNMERENETLSTDFCNTVE